jgi:hypothetical protein
LGLRRFFLRRLLRRRRRGAGLQQRSRHADEDSAFQVHCIFS